MYIDKLFWCEYKPKLNLFILWSDHASSEDMD